MAGIAPAPGSFRANILGSMSPLWNLDRSYLLRSWERYKQYRVSSGTCGAVNPKAFKQVFGGTAGSSLALFKGFDTDRNNLVDAIEVFDTIALCATDLPLMARVRLIFMFHDENEDENLSWDELEMMINSTQRGMSKMTGNNIVTAHVDSLVSTIQSTLEKSTSVHTQTSRSTNTMSINREDWCVFCKFNVEVQSYFKAIAALVEPSPVLSLPTGGQSSPPLHQAPSRRFAHRPRPEVGPGLPFKSGCSALVPS